MKLWIGPILLVTNCLASAYIPLTQSLSKHAYQMNYGFEAWNSWQSRNESGNAIEYKSEDYYRYLDAIVGFDYGFSDRFQLGVSTKFRAVQSAEDFEDEVVTSQISGAHSAVFHAQYTFPMSGDWQYAVFFDFEQRLFTNEEFRGVVPNGLTLGDDGESTSFGGGMTYYFSAFRFFTLRSLYRSPAPNLSGEIFTELEYAIGSKNYNTVWGIENVFSMAQDPYKDDPESKPLIKRGNTQLYNSINREWIAPYVSFNSVMGDNFRVNFKITQILSGISTDIGTKVGLNISYRTEAKTKAEKFKERFLEYGLEGRVVKMAPGREKVAVDFGLTNGSEVGDRVDFFITNFKGDYEIIATGVITKLNSSRSVVKITRRYSKIRVEAGTEAKSKRIDD